MTAAKPLVVADALGRSQRPSRLVVDIVTAMAVGLLAAFMILFVSRPVVDQVLFEWGLSYSDRVDVPPGQGDIDVLTAASLYVSLGTVGSASAFEGSTATIWLAENADRVGEVVDRSFVAGGPLTGGVWLDRSTAYELGISLGDEVLLAAGDTNAEDATCALPVAGWVRPYQDPSTAGRVALAVVSQQDCVQGLRPAADSAIAFDTGDGKGAAAHIADALRSQPGTAVGTLSISLVAIALWYLVGRRVAARVFSDGRHTADVLISLGVSRRVLRVLQSVIFLAVMAPAAMFSPLLARAAVGAIADFYIQPGHLLLTVAMLLLVALAASRSQRSVPASPEKGP